MSATTPTPTAPAPRPHDPPTPGPVEQVVAHQGHPPEDAPCQDCALASEDPARDPRFREQLLLAWRIIQTRERTLRRLLHRLAQANPPPAPCPADGDGCFACGATLTRQPAGHLSCRQPGCHAWVLYELEASLSRAEKAADLVRRLAEALEATAGPGVKPEQHCWCPNGACHDFDAPKNGWPDCASATAALAAARTFLAQEPSR